MMIRPVAGSISTCFTSKPAPLAALMARFKSVCLKGLGCSDLAEFGLAELMTHLSWCHYRLQAPMLQLEKARARRACRAIARFLDSDLANIRCGVAADDDPMIGGVVPVG